VVLSAMLWTLVDKTYQARRLEARIHIQEQHLSQWQQMICMDLLSNLPLEKGGIKQKVLSLTTIIICSALAQAQLDLLDTRLSRALIVKREVICKKLNSRTRPVLIFVVGIQGRAQRMTVKSMQGLYQIVKLPKTINLLLQDIWDPYLGPNYRQRQRENLVKAIAEFDNPLEMFFMLQLEPLETLPFSFGNPSNPLRRPDVRDIIELFETKFEVKFLVSLQTLDDGVRYAMENFASVCPKNSSVNPEGYAECSELHLRGRMTADAMEYITGQLQMISKEYYRVLWYDDMNTNRHTLDRPLQMFLGVRVGAARKIVGGIKKQKPVMASLSPQQKMFLFRLVGAVKTAQWTPILRDDVDLAKFKLVDKSYRIEEVCVP